jgi:hypothetical protein
MRFQARAIKNEPILVDRAASYFGTAGQVFMIRAKIRANGTLTLTDEKLVFEQSDSGTFIEIPLQDIHRLGMGRWHEGTATFVPVLKITYQGNLVFGVHVAHPERWVEAIEEVAVRQNLPSLTEPRRDPRTVFRLSRILIAGFMILLILSMALPMLFSWMQNNTMRGQLDPSSESLEMVNP